MVEEDGAATGIVLLVEDDPRIASFMTRAIRAKGLTVEWVTTGGEALERVARGGVALQILDLGLPDIDGLEVLRIERERGDDLPVVIVTARSGAEDQATARELGVAGYLCKPFPLAELLAVIRSATGADAGPAG